MTKEEKKKALIAGGLVAALIFLWWLLRKTGKYNPIVNGAGKPAGTSYLTYNIPPINADGLAVPNFGDIIIQSGNPSVGGYGCGGCDQTSYYGSTAQLAAGLPGSETYSNYQAALTEATNNLSFNTSYSITPGTAFTPETSPLAPPVSGNV